MSSTEHQRKLILIADDDPDGRQALSQFFVYRGYRTAGAPKPPACDAFLAKPSDLEDLLACVRRLIGAADIGGYGA